MKFQAVQTLIESYLQDNWTANTLIFENQPVNTELYEEWSRCTIQFGDTNRKSLGNSFYRTSGVLFFDVYVRPGVGSNRAVELIDTAVNLLRDKSLSPTSPDGTPTVHFLEPAVMKSYGEKTGWVSTQLAYSFYFDVGA